ncbi:MAG TPA: YcxB family protein [Thermoanaerobaculia bacterium]|nr:YcxB family protein [Thermoanaerobaculia bacterium]
MDPAEKDITLVYSEALLRKVAWAYWRRAVGWRGLLAVGLLSTSFVFLLISGDRSWWVGAMGTMLAFAIAFGITLYRVQLGRSLTKFRLGKPTSTFTISAGGFRVTSASGNIELPWNMISEVARFPEFWILYSSRAYYMTFPLTAVDAEAQELVLGRFRAAGTKIS